ncbi:uncharacterized protein B0H18DRAFT_1120304 [Fomitopsis serialis]|uniref:uncharacterized protein n=1 Tax=Fomitopsis serialis TaxID=139415 RepID=UPI0020081A95|nr:uncharacterized protein B0H18DRAFT_1120304 [Neoantrodia serialis]KAH9923659.1 hypothetical protein B0H18DRAFT_1120304 [Neoantrodia serialis]
MPFSAAESKLVSIFVQSVLYGNYMTLFFTTTKALLWKRPSGNPLRRNMLFVSFLMFGIATTHVATNFSRIILAFINNVDAPGGPAAFFNEMSNFTQMFGSTLYVAQTLLGDAMVLYRSYLVWGRKLWVIAFPFVLLLGSTATGVGILYSFDKVDPEASIFVVQLGHWITAFFSMTFATNVVCTGAFPSFVPDIISCRGTRVRILCKYSVGGVPDLGRQPDPSFLQVPGPAPVMILIVESGALYSATLLALLILYNVDSWFQYVVLDAVSSIVGIVFSVIMLRIATGESNAEGETALLEPTGVASGVQLSRQWVYL